MIFCVQLYYHVFQQHTRVVIYHHDKARPYTARIVQSVLKPTASTCCHGLNARQTFPQQITTGCHGSSCSTTSTPSSQPARTDSNPAENGYVTIWPHLTTAMFSEVQCLRVLRQRVATHAINLSCRWTSSDSPCALHTERLIFVLHITQTLLFDVVWLSFLVFIKQT